MCSIVLSYICILILQNSVSEYNMILWDNSHLDSLLETPKIIEIKLYPNLNP